jgi:adenylate cyclase
MMQSLVAAHNEVACHNRQAPAAHAKEGGVVSLIEPWRYYRATRMRTWRRVSACAQNRVEEAVPEYEATVASNRNWLLAVATLGWCKFQTGLIEDAIPLHEQAIRLSPRDNLLGVWYLRIGIVHLLQSRTDEAIPWLENARNFDPRHPQPHPWLAAAYALKGDTECAAVELAEARMLNGDDRYTSIARLKAAGYFGVPKIRALYEATYFAGLRKAGMPEE